MVYKQSFLSADSVALVNDNDCIITKLKYQPKTCQKSLEAYLEKSCQKPQDELINQLSQQVELLNKVIKSDLPLEKIITIFKQYCYNNDSQPLMMFQCYQKDELWCLVFSRHIKISEGKYYRINLDLRYNKMENVDLSTNKIYSDEINQDIFEYFLQSQVYENCCKNKLVKTEIKLILN
ncbi:MAG: hypothetical protein ACI4WG_04775 [Erysipelotrichaceae bacterium]